MKCMNVTGSLLTLIDGVRMKTGASQQVMPNHCVVVAVCLQWHQLCRIRCEF